MAPKKPKADAEVTMPALMEVTFEIEGIPPGYIGNAWSEEQAVRIPPYPKRTEKKPEVEPDFDAIANGQRRLLNPPRDNATDGFPATALKDAMVTAGMRLTKLVGTELRAQLRVLGGPDGLIPIRGSDWKTFSRTGNLGGKKGSGCIITQPFYPVPWAATVAIRYACLTEEQVLSLVETAGGLIGIGAWRPAITNGDYGLFRINLKAGFKPKKVSLR